MAGTRDPRGRQGGQRGMLNRPTPSALSDQPEPSEAPTVQPGPLRERCRGDSDCPDAQKCCNSSCGHQCLPGAPGGEAGWDRMGTEGGDTAQRPGVMPGLAAAMAQGCGTKRDPSPYVCKRGLCRARGGDTLHSPQLGTGVERGQCDQPLVRPPIMLSSCSTVQRTAALPQSLEGHCSTSGDASGTRTAPHPMCAVTSCAAGTVGQTAKVRGLGATPKV